jgi:hypothetical protein
MRRKLFTGVAAVALAAAVSVPATAAPLDVTQNANAAALVAALVAGNPGISVIPGSETFIGDPVAAGTFTGGTGLLPFESGVILTSGQATLAEGPNNSDNATLSNTGGSDPDLDGLNGAPGINDAAILQFQFTAVAPVISFQYVFGSEEYNEFVNSNFNDVFGFFLNGTNIALLPGSGQPVAINNVNCAANSAFYTNNDPVANGDGGTGCGAPAGINLQYDGFAGINPAFALFAQGAALAGGQINTIKLAIGDSGDTVLDSGVFLKAGSFVNQPVPEPMTLSLFGLGVAVAAARRFRSRKNV